MKNTLLFLSFFFFLFFYIACSPQQKKADENTGEQTQNVKETNTVSDNNDVKKATENVVQEPKIDLAKELPILKNESEERYYQNGALVINLLPMDLAMNTAQELIQKLFPEGKVTPASSTEVFDAFNIEQKSRKYSVIVSYGQGSDGNFVLNKFYIFTGNFRPELLEKIVL